MIRRLFLLNGVAILSVVCSHASGWGLIAMTWWADRYRPDIVSNSDHIGTLSYYSLLAVRGLGSYAVPAFIFVSGFFAAYAARGSRSAWGWKTVLTRLRNLLIPYLIWSIMIFVTEALEGITYAPAEYLVRLVFGGAHPVYFFVPVICQFYLLSPLVITIARNRARRLLLISALLQLLALSLRYLAPLGVDVPALAPVTDLSFPMYAFFFSSGVVSSLYLQRIKEWLLGFKWVLLLAASGLWLLTIVESEVVFRLTGIRRGAGPGTFSTNLYSVALIASFLAFHQLSIPFSDRLYRLGSRSLGIYLLHPKVLEFTARAVQKFLPWVLAHQVIFQPMLVISAVGGPILLMTLVAKSPARKVYRYLFG